MDLQTRPSLPELDAARPWAHFSGARSWRDSDGVPSSSFLASSAWPAGSLVRMDPARTYRRFPRRTKRRRISRTPDATIDVGTCGGLFGANYVLYFEITWLPFYLVRERHLSMGTMAKIGGLGYLCYAAAAVVFGWISDRWIADSCSQNFCACRSGDCRAIPPWLHPRRSHGLCYSAATSVRSRWHVRIQYLAITQTLAGPRMAGRWTGWQNSLGNLARCQRAGSDRIRNRLHRTVLRGIRDHGFRRTARCCFLFLCDWPGEGDRLGRMTRKRRRGRCRLVD